jgi:hypothetical protein
LTFGVLSRDTRSRLRIWPPNSASRASVRQINVSSFEKVQKAVKNRVAAMGTRRLCRCVSLQPFPWWEKLTMDVSLRVRFTATERHPSQQVG